MEGELESSTALASFLGWQLTVMGVVALFTTSILTSRVVRRYGLRLGLLAMPAVVTLSIVLLAVGGTLGLSTSFLFWTATAARTLNIALGFSLSQAMGSLLFQPLQGHVRGAAQTISEGIIQPLAIGLAGVILLILNTTLGSECSRPGLCLHRCGDSMVLVHLCACAPVSTGHERGAEEKSPG